MKKKLENLISLDDFKAGWKAEQAKKTKRTETGLNVLNENIEEIIPEGLPEDNPVENKSFDLESLSEGTIDEIVNYLREVLLDLEQQGIIDEETTDRLDEESDGDWIAWINSVLAIEDMPEEAFNEIDKIIDESDEFPHFDEDLPDDVECPDCDGTGVDDDGNECERCGGEGREGRPWDIPPD